MSGLETPRKKNVTQNVRGLICMGICDSLPTKNRVFLQQIIYPVCNSYRRFSWDSKYACDLIATSFPRPIRAITLPYIADLFLTKSISLVCLVVYLLHCLFIGCLLHRAFEEGIFPLIFIRLPSYGPNGGGSAPGMLGQEKGGNDHDLLVPEASGSIVCPQGFSSSLALALTTTKHLTPMPLLNSHSNSHKGF